MLLNLNICNTEFRAYKTFTKFGVLVLVIENIDRLEEKINGATIIVTFIKKIDSKKIKYNCKIFKYQI
jgi:hypothetical protein